MAAVWKATICIAWLIVTLYLAAVGFHAAWTYGLRHQDNRNGYTYEFDGQPINFRTRADVAEFRRQVNWERGNYAELLFTWLPHKWSLFAVPMIFGLFGGACNAVWKLARDKIEEVTGIDCIMWPTWGLVAGLAVYAAVTVVPKILVANEPEPSWHSLMWIAFFGGLFADHAYDFVRRRMVAVFGQPSRTKR